MLTTNTTLSCEGRYSNNLLDVELHRLTVPFVLQIISFIAGAWTDHLLHHRPPCLQGRTNAPIKAGWEFLLDVAAGLCVSLPHVYISVCTCVRATRNTMMWKRKSCQPFRDYCIGFFVLLCSLRWGILFILKYWAPGHFYSCCIYCMSVSYVYFGKVANALHYNKIYVRVWNKWIVWFNIVLKEKLDSKKKKNPLTENSANPCAVY